MIIGPHITLDWETGIGSGQTPRISLPGDALSVDPPKQVLFSNIDPIAFPPVASSANVVYHTLPSGWCFRKPIASTQWWLRAKVNAGRIFRLN
jgi:hypothetical protein